MKQGRRQKKVPYWQAVALAVLMFIAIFETCWAVYMLKVNPSFQTTTEIIKKEHLEYDKKWDCLHYMTQSICCEQKHWVTTTDLTTNESVRYYNCIKYEKSK